MTTARLALIAHHIIQNQTLFTGPIDKMEWAYDKAASKLNIEEATKIYRMTQSNEEFRVVDIFKSNPLFEPAIYKELTREQMRAIATKQFKTLHAEILKRGIYTHQQIIDGHEQFLQDQNCPRGNVPLIIKQTLHFGMYMKTLINFGSTEYHKKLIDGAARLDYTGCFIMTELSHGSNVMELRTTATYDPETKEFVLNTPTERDIKIWIGNLGKDAKYGIVFAKLVTLGKDYGVHPFVVQLRDNVFHRPLSGLLIGDMGSKIGYQFLDNGFIRFSNHRVGREALLNKFFQVDEDGTYHTVIPSKTKRFAFLLQTLSFGRIFMSLGAAVGQIYSTSISLRWAHLRRQFGKPGEAAEIPLVNYQLHQYRLVPKLARGFVMKFAVDEIMQLYVDLKPQLIDPTKNLEFLHAIATFTKSYSSTAAQRTYEEVRQSLGGFGYSYYSELHSMINDNDVNQTWEGDNKVLLQQTARFILKNCNRIQNGKEVISEHVMYLKNDPKIAQQEISAIDFNGCTLSDIIKVYKAFTIMDSLAAGHDMFDTYLSSVPFSLNPMATGFGEVFFLEAYQRRIAHSTGDTHAIFEKLGVLFALWNIVEKSGEFRERDLLSSDQISQIKDRILTLNKELQNELIPLTRVTESYHYYNVFSSEDFYEKFLAVMTQAPGAFSRVSNYQDCLMPGYDKQY